MPDTWGRMLQVSIFGESHGKAVGVVIGGLPPGEEIDPGRLGREMLRRAPGQGEHSTSRREPDEVEILSGLKEGKTTGSPVCGVIFNKDVRSGDYDANILRPGHADWTALIKYGGHADMRGGGHFSGRLTAPLVFAGALAKQVLGRRGIEVYGRISRIGDVTDPEPDCLPERWAEISGGGFPAAYAQAMTDEIIRAKQDGDSVGGIVEAAAFGLPGGLGEPFFGSVESVVASMLFSIPAVKGVEFGAGFRLAETRGSKANDELFIQDGSISARTNHSGGILGGITNGMPLIVRAAVKPTPSIGREQQTVDAASMRPAALAVRGRHDPCIVPRAVPAVEAGIALCVLDLLMAEGKCRRE